jgi:hypothetical protein
MTCRCTDEGVADADGLRRQMREGLRALGYETEDGEEPSLSAIVMSLEHDLGGWHVSSIACDMWCGAGIRRYEYRDGAVRAGNWVHTQGDLAEDCLAQLWVHARDWLAGQSREVDPAAPAS